jgi:superfamily II RNA helicase
VTKDHHVDDDTIRTTTTTDSCLIQKINDEIATNDDREEDISTTAREEVMIMSREEIDGRKALCRIFGLDPPPTMRHTLREKKQSTTTTPTTNTDQMNDMIPYQMVKNQASYAGSHASQDSIYGTLSDDCLQQISLSLLKLFGIVNDDHTNSNHNHNTVNNNDETTIHQPTKYHQLFSHQVIAISAALAGKHVIVCTGTGSGKSLCFLLPVLTAAYQHNRVSLLLYPTKALAQDQYSNLIITMIDSDDDLQRHIRPMTLDGDTNHSIHKCKKK